MMSSDVLWRWHNTGHQDSVPASTVASPAHHFDFLDDKVVGPGLQEVHGGEQLVVARRLLSGHGAFRNHSSCKARRSSVGASATAPNVTHLMRTSQRLRSAPRI